MEAITRKLWLALACNVATAITGAFTECRCWAGGTMDRTDFLTAMRTGGTDVAANPAIVVVSPQVDAFAFAY